MNTPSNKRYSSSSEYATPRAIDDFENSLYFSFTGDDNNLPNKENSINGDTWTVTELGRSTTAGPSNSSKAKTPLLRKVLQSNLTPHKKQNNSKKVSFSYLSQQNSLEEPTEKIVKTTHTTFDLEPIKESLQKATIVLDRTAFGENDNEQDAYSEMVDVADDLDDDMHNTIIENPSSVKQNTDLLATTSVSNAFEVDQAKEPNKMNDTQDKSENGSKPPQNVVSSKILSETSTKPQQTRNVTKLERSRLVKENRKSTLPVAKKSVRLTVYKRRSSTLIEPRKIIPRKSLEVLKQVANKLAKSIPAGNAKHVKPVAKFVTSTSRECAARVSVSNLTVKSTDSSKSILGSKTRLTIAQQPPKLAIVSTRQSIANNIGAKRRETKQRITKLAVANVITSQSMSTTSSAAFVKQDFRKPTEVPRKKVAKENSLQCQYCDKCFVKSYGMTTHLLEKCEKIPASARRQLLQKAERSNTITSKQSDNYRIMHQETDSISKYSRFFVNMSNEGASGMKVEIEESLKHLRTELRKIKNSHTGIIRTPSKPIRCHICKKLFLDCVEYADHISNHPSN